jgi:glycosyltransferase involved in cell wall biosynthesis
VRDNDNEVPPAGGGRSREVAPVPLVIATMLRGDGITGVDTHVRQLRRYLEKRGTASTLVTPFSWCRPLTYPVFGIRPLVLERCHRPASVAWYLYWHEVFLRHALGRRLTKIGACVIDTQDPHAAHAALTARRGPHQRVVLTVHFNVSNANLWADKKQIRRDGAVFRAIRRVEREAISRVDGLVYVSRWARDALVGWLPEAAAVPSAVIGNFIAPSLATRSEPLGDLVTVGNLEIVKNHRFLLEILAEAKRAGRLLTLDIFGEGPCREDLLRQAHSLGVEEQVRFRGYKPDVRELLPGYRVYVHASYSESSSLAIMEAMAAGLPIVAGGIGPIPELCEDGVEARFWPLDDPARAAVVLIDLLDCEPERLKAARAALERFHQDYDADIVGPKLLSFLMGTTPGPAGVVLGAPAPLA